MESASGHFCTFCDDFGLGAVILAWTVILLKEVDCVEEGPAATQPLPLRGDVLVLDRSDREQRSHATR